jgi:hypothetical protein
LPSLLITLNNNALIQKYIGFRANEIEIIDDGIINRKAEDGNTH